MKKLLNTLYISEENSYLLLDGENVVVQQENQVKHRFPLSNLESIVMFNYKGCSPQLMGKCVEYGIALNFLTPFGKFLARVTGEKKGNVFVRKEQILLFQTPPVELIQNTVATKLLNTIQLVKRTLRDFPEIDQDNKVTECIEKLKKIIKKVYSEQDKMILLGLEGSGAKAYFYIFNRLILQQNEDFCLTGRTKRPPLDRVNAVLSFLYTLWTMNYASAIESAGLDSYVGFYHEMRSGRCSLACDMVEETRCIVERMVLSMINRKQLKADDFEVQVGGAVFLNERGKKKVLQSWQEKKQKVVMHPYLKQKIKLGILPFVQSHLMAKYIRGEIDEYPCFIVK